MPTKATTDQPLVRLSPRSKSALRAAQEKIAAAAGRPVPLASLVDEVLAAHLDAYVSARLQALQPVANLGGGR